MSDDRAQTDANPQLSPEEWQELAIRVLKSCGYGRLLLVGLGEAMLLCEFLRHGVDATCMVASRAVAATLDAVAPGRTRVFDGTASLCSGMNERFDNVVFIVDSTTPEAWCDAIGAPESLLRFASGVVVVLRGQTASEDTVSTWDARLAAVGVRRPMLSGGMVQHGVGGRSEGLVVLCYRPCSVVGPDGSADLAGSRLRASWEGGQSGREMLYGIASGYMRPGDRVLGAGVELEMEGELLANTAATSITRVPPDLAEGLPMSSTPAGDPDMSRENVPSVGLQDYDTDEFDFILADGTRCALLQPWDEALRVLTPGGRLCVLHVIRREDVHEPGFPIWKQLEACGLLLEEGWIEQRGVVQEGHSAWVTRRLSVSDTSAKVGDRLLLVLMNPIASYGTRAKIDLREDDGPNVLAFARDYDNPWLVRGLVAMGLRATSVDLRVRMAEGVLDTASEDSADYGAALCVRCYAAIEQGSDALTLDKLRLRAANYAETHAVNPSVLRWQISLLYVAGLMAMQIGDLPGAELLFFRVGKFDALDFSPLLGTKTVGASFRLGLIAFARGDSEAARTAWTRALKEARRLLQQGDWREVIVDIGCPVTFGLPELAAVALEGARAAGGLHALSRYSGRPALVWQALHCTLADVAQAQNLELRSLRSWAGELDRAKTWLQQHAAAWELQASRKDEQVASLQKANDQLLESKEWLEQQRSAWEAQASHKDKEVSSLVKDYALLAEGKAWLEQQRSAWEMEAGSKEAQVVALMDENCRLQQAANYAEELQRGFAERIQGKDQEVLALGEKCRGLADRYTQLEQESAARELELAAQNRKLQESALQLAQRMDAMLGEIRAIAGASIGEGQRLRAIESTRWFKLGRRFKLIR